MPSMLIHAKHGEQFSPSFSSFCCLAICLECNRCLTDADYSNQKMLLSKAFKRCKERKYN